MLDFFSFDFKNLLICWNE